MKIAVGILTRDRPAGLIAAMQSLYATASGTHDIRYYVRCDRDDERTHRAVMCCDPQDPAPWMVIGERPETLGQAWNELAAKSAAWGWDAFCVITDDVVSITPNWDLGVAELIGPRGLLAFGWNDLIHPNNITYPVVSRRWYEAVGRLFPEYFPFWFSETWMAQVYDLVVGTQMPIASDMRITGPDTKTLNMRDVAFWVDLFAATLPMRAEEAFAVQLKLALPLVDTGPILAKCERLCAGYNVEAIEAHRRTDFDEPSPRYLAAKTRADQLLASLHSERNKDAA